MCCKAGCIPKLFSCQTAHSAEVLESGESPQGTGVAEALPDGVSAWTPGPGASDSNGAGSSSPCRTHTHTRAQIQVLPAIVFFTISILIAIKILKG